MNFVTIVIIYPYSRCKSSYESCSCVRGDFANVFEGHDCTITALISNMSKCHVLEVF